MASISDALHRYADAYVTMEVFTSFADFTESWFRSALVCTAAAWLSWRIYRVTAKPVDELVSLLGLEVPSAPIISLAALKSDGINLQWKSPDLSSSVTKHHIHVNGVHIGEISARETNIIIYGLKPGTSYNVRVVALNNNFHSTSNPLRFTTLPATAEPFGYPDTTSDGIEQHEHDRPVLVRPYKTPLDASVHNPSTPLTREHSSSISQKQRSPNLRRITAGSDEAGKIRHIPHESGAGNVNQLHSDLEKVAREIKELESLERIENEEADRHKTEVTDSRERLRTQLHDKETTSRELRKEVKELERKNTTKTQHKTAIEKKLQQKQADRAKLKDDIVHWGEEIEKFHKDVADIAIQKEELERSMLTKLEDMRQQLADRQQSNKAIEDENKDIANKIKELAREKSADPANAADSAAEAQTVTFQDENRMWDEKLMGLQGRYTVAWNAMLGAESVSGNAQQHLEHLQQRRMNSPQLFEATPTLDPVSLRQSSKSVDRAGSVRSDPNTVASLGLTSMTPISYPSHIATGFQSSSPFFNANNGMSIKPEVLQTEALSQAQIDALTGGAPMSPSTAGALLPSDLLADDTDQRGTGAEAMQREPSQSAMLHRRPRPISFSAEVASLNASNRNSAALPGLGPIPGLGKAATFDASGHVPSSPASAESQSPGVFTSPKESSTHLPFGPTDGHMDFDRRSLKSNAGSSRGPGGSRFAAILGLGAKGKSLTDQGPLLGSLSGSQTQSLPRQAPSDQEPSSRRRGSHSGSSWIQPLSNAFARNANGSSKDIMNNTDGTAGSSTSRRFVNSFSVLGRNRDLAQASSPLTRTVDVIGTPHHPSELPRPSSGSEGRFGWPSEHPTHRSSPLGPDWGSAMASSYSRQPSRRPSLLGPDMHDLDGAPLDSPQPGLQQPPIGTRPAALRDDSTDSNPASITPPRLNPAAPSFNLFRRKVKVDDDKEKSADKVKSKDKSKILSTMQPTNGETSQMNNDEQSSPPESRKSKDTRSVSTLGDSMDFSAASRDSLERSWSATAPDAGQLTPNSALMTGRDRETFMQKLSRKTSGSKFKAPFSKDNKGFFGSTRRGPPTVDGATPDELEEDGIVLSRSVDSMPDIAATMSGTPNATNAEASGKNNRSSGRWGSLKLSRKKDKDRGAGRTESVASDTGEDEDTSTVFIDEST